MAKFTVDAVARNDQGKGASRRLRREGLVPGIIYGSAEPKAVSVIGKDLYRMLLEDGFYSSILDINLEGQTEKVIIKDLQRHPSKPVVLHADFQRIDDNQKIKLQVPVAFVNFEKSAAAKAAAKFAQEASTVEILCLPKDLPEALEVDLSNIALGQIAHTSDITVPEGVEIVALRRGEDHDQSIGYCYAPRGARAAK
ncbi:MAG: 50S ribosomal protein L25/general stress protein Ctc [Oceanospirillales bacterium]|uniref:Large ribosomal subunit protein bL25 n=1 Tax=Marinobacterium halophilum TaxID=267374 RepID=A0A2P8EQS1_9GAMM|nr:50S ribosomal protein L25/general stress protein Ctc [Marinobacterium halophilum]MBR9829399.1 50S ribosomal protein L25/general stress protein Ctc [Oceanospirillales bacterium]PSL11811.1 LSU ribosomal protein L25P [Marinobacterium halophilum]